MSEKILAIKGKLIDGTGKIIKDATIVVENSRIKAVGKSEEIEIPEEAKVIDATGKVVMPGLIDAHLHLMGLTSDELVKQRITRPYEIRMLKALRDARDLLQAGYTTVRDCGGKCGLYIKRAMKEDWSKTFINAPRILAAGYVLTQTYGHAEQHFLPYDYAQEVNPAICDGPWECMKKARFALREGADFIKICSTGGVLSEKDQPKDVQFTLEEIKAIVKAAENAGTYVAAHAEGGKGIKNAIQAGVRTIEHGDLIDEEGIRMAKENDTIVVVTPAIDKAIIGGGVEAGIPKWGVEKEKRLHSKAIENFRKMKEKGVTIAAATDYIGSPLMKMGNNSITLEILVKECDFDPMEAIVAGTKNGAMACGLENKIGTIEKGKIADIIIVDGNPLKDIAILQDIEKIEKVIKSGRIAVNRSKN